PARGRGRRPRGGRLEVLFVRRDGDADWQTLVRGTPRVGERVHLPDGSGEWVAALGDGFWRLRLLFDEPVPAWLDRVGEVPLPPYIARPDGPNPTDRARYQTVFARVPGAVAAPTAGLHLTEALLDALGRVGIEVV